MKKYIITAVTGLLVLCIIPSFNIFAESKAEKYLGKRDTCIDIIKIQETRILDDQTILFELSSNEVYISRLPNQCYGLKMADAFSYSTSLSRLCKQDIIRVLEEDTTATSSCGLGEFILLRGVKNLGSAKKLLKDEGVLDSLVKEGAFETAFPGEEK